MNIISIDISGRIDTGKISVLRSIKEVGEELDINFFVVVVGAFARVIFEHIHRIPASRVTEDIDIDVEVGSWWDFRHLTGALIDRGLLTATKSPHRFIASSINAVVNIVLYGVRIDEAKSINWLPDHEMIVSMLGFEEAYESALEVRLSNDPPLEIRVPSVPALALLKIISWADGYPRRGYEAHDILFILENYDATGVEAKLYESHVPVLTEEGFDSRLASVRLLGRDIALLGSPEAIKTVEEILIRETDEGQEFRMLSNMAKGTSFQGTEFEATLQLLKKLLRGIQEGKPRE
jgi:predicted nucleotidyltransferase